MRDRVAWILSLAFVLDLTLTAGTFGQSVVTAAPPAQLVFVPNPYACSVLKHPTLPALYLGCYAAPDSKNLVTYRLNPDGTLIASSAKVHDDYFAGSGTNLPCQYRIYRPSILPEKHLLYILAGADYPVQCYTNVTRNEIAVLGLDEQGQPAKLIKALRTDHTGLEYLVGLQCDPATRRLYLNYWTSLDWCELGDDGLPVSGTVHPIVYMSTSWYYAYVPQWERFYVIYSSLSLRICKLAADGLSADFVQQGTMCYGDSACIEASTKYRKLYNLDLSGPPRLVVCLLTKDGRLTSVPRYFPMPDAIRFRGDYNAGRLYVWTKDNVWKTYALDADGFPTGTPQVAALGCGEIRDVYVDEPSGKVYVACTQAPK